MCENKDKEFVKPISIIGKEWAKGRDVNESEFFKSNTDLKATYSEGELLTLNALFILCKTVIF